MFLCLKKRRPSPISNFLPVASTVLLPKILLPTITLGSIFRNICFQRGPLAVRVDKIQKKRIPLNKDQVARCLIQKGCVKFSISPPFVYSSGKTGPIYCDNRKIISYPSERRLIVDAFVEVVGGAFREDGYDMLGGIATGGIPYGAMIAERLGVPMVYIRSKAKGHGGKSQIEGDYREGDRVLLIEDLVNQGSSLGRVAGVLEREKLTPLACFCIVDYQMPRAKEICREKNIKMFSLTNLDTIVDMWNLSPENLREIESWRKSFDGQPGT